MYDVIVTMVTEMSLSSQVSSTQLCSSIHCFAMQWHTLCCYAVACIVAMQWHTLAGIHLVSIQWHMLCCYAVAYNMLLCSGICCHVLQWHTLCCYAVVYPVLLYIGMRCIATQTLLPQSGLNFILKCDMRARSLLGKFPTYCGISLCEQSAISCLRVCVCVCVGGGGGVRVNFAVVRVGRGGICFF